MKSLLLFSIFMLLSSSVEASSFKEGEYYQVLKNPISDKKEVREFFSFYCPHCFRQEPLMHDISVWLPSDVPLEKNNVDSMPGRDIEIEHALSKALITAEQLKVKDKMVKAIFNYIHVSKAKFDNINDIRNLFVVNGVKADQFDKIYSSFSVNTIANDMLKKTTALRQQGFNRVPTLIINGKYKTITDKIKSEEEYKSLISYLLSKEP